MEYGRKIGLAYSQDGISWTKYNDPSTTSTLYADSDPVLTAGPGNWEGTDVENGNILVDVNDGNMLHLWYAGTGYPQTTYPWKIGHATLSLDTLKVSGIERTELDYFPYEFFLNQNYPNPFNPSTTIKFSLPKSEYVELKVYSILGKEVAELVSNNLFAGVYQYQFDGSNLASGIYYYQIIAGEYKEVKKMILLR